MYNCHSGRKAPSVYRRSASNAAKRIVRDREVARGLVQRLRESSGMKFQGLLEESPWSRSSKLVRRWWRLEVVRRIGISAFDTHTGNVSSVRWLGHQIKQNPYDIWTAQEILVECDVDFVIETGTYFGGSALFLASLFDLLGRGHVVTIDTETCPERPLHPRITYLHGSSTDPRTVLQVRDLVKLHEAKKPLVLLDSDHRARHVLPELRSYADLVPIGGYIIVQDGVVDELSRFAALRPGPLDAIKKFVCEDNRFEIDEERSAKFLFHYSPHGCLRRVI